MVSNRDGQLDTTSLPMLKYGLVFDEAPQQVLYLVLACVHGWREQGFAVFLFGGDHELVLSFDELLLVAASNLLLGNVLTSVDTLLIEVIRALAEQFEFE